MSRSGHCIAGHPVPVSAVSRTPCMWLGAGVTGGLIAFLGPCCRWTLGWTLELETKVHPKVRNHGEGPYYGLLLVESGYYRFHI